MSLRAFSGAGSWLLWQVKGARVLLPMAAPNPAPSLPASQPGCAADSGGSLKMDVRWAGVLGANFAMLWVFTVCDQGQSWEELETLRDGAGAAPGVAALGRVITTVVMRAMTVAVPGAKFVPVPS